MALIINDEDLGFADIGGAMFKMVGPLEADLPIMFMLSLPRFPVVVRVGNDMSFWATAAQNRTCISNSLEAWAIRGRGSQNHGRSVAKTNVLCPFSGLLQKDAVPTYSPKLVCPDFVCLKK